MPRVVDVDARRREIVEATIRLIARGGLEAATMRDIAAEAGWTTGVVNHYFADKRELLRSTLAYSIRRRLATRGHGGDEAARRGGDEAARHRGDEAARHAGDGPAARLRDELAAALPLDDEGRRHWLVTAAFLSQAAGDPEMAMVQRDAYRGFRANVAQRILESDGGEMSAALDLAERLIATIDGVAMQAMFDPESWPAERQQAVLDAALAAR